MLRQAVKEQGSRVLFEKIDPINASMLSSSYRCQWNAQDVLKTHQKFNGDSGDSELYTDIVRYAKWRDTSEYRLRLHSGYFSLPCCNAMSH